MQIAFQHAAIRAVRRRERARCDPEAATLQDPADLVFVRPRKAGHEEKGPLMILPHPVLYEF